MATWKKVLLEGTSSVGDLSDVTITNASDAQILVHDGTDFDNVDVSGDVTITNGGAVTIANDAVTTLKILDANVTLAKMADNSVDSDQYVDGSIDTIHIGDSQVTFAKLANLSALSVMGNSSGIAATPTNIAIDTDLSSVSASNDTVASALAIKSYVDTQVASGYDLNISADTGTAQVITNGETLDLAGTSNQITTTTGSNSVTFSIPTAFTAPGSIASTTTITAATGLTVTTGGATVTAGGLTVSAGGADITGTLDVTGVATFDTNVTIAGNLSVTGEVTSTSTTELLVEDKTILVASGASAAGSANNAGFVVDTSALTTHTGDAKLNYLESGATFSEWQMIKAEGGTPKDSAYLAGMAVGTSQSDLNTNYDCGLGSLGWDGTSLYVQTA